MIRPRVLTSNGEAVVFSSAASNLAAGDANGARDVFLFDRTTNTLEVVSAAVGGKRPGSGDSFDAAISGDGRYVVFRSSANDLADNDSGEPGYELYRRDRSTGVTEMITTGHVRTTSDAFGRPPDTPMFMSLDGNTVVFVSQDRFDERDANTGPDVYVWREGAVDIVSIDSGGSSAATGVSPDVSADGRWIAFRSKAANLTEDKKLNCSECGNIFLRDLEQGRTQLVSHNAEHSGSGNSFSPVRPVVSGDGRFVLYGSGSTDLVKDGTSGDGLYLWDRDAEENQLVSRTSAGLPAFFPLSGGDYDMSADGSRVIFTASTAFPETMAPVPTACFASCSEVVLRDVASGENIFVSRTEAGESADGQSHWFQMSDDGSAVTFVGDGRFLGGGFADTAPAAFRFDVATRHLEVVGRIRSDVRDPCCPGISGDGSTVAFATLEQIDGSDRNDVSDVYVAAVAPDERGIAPAASLRDKRLQVEGHVPCPGTATDLELRIEQAGQRARGESAVDCKDKKMSWEMELASRGVRAGKAEACATARQRDGETVLTTLSWCRQIEIAAATSEKRASGATLVIAGGIAFVAMALIAYAAIRRRRRTS